MRILLLLHSFNSLAQRLYVELARDGHELSVELDINDETTCEAVRLFRPQLVLAPFLKRAIPSAVWRRHRCLIVHPGPVGDRGPAALDWAILRSEPHWGVTVLQATDVLDGGPVWASAQFPMRRARKGSLYRLEVTEATVLAVREALARVARGERPLPAPAPLPALRPAPTAQERSIDWNHDDSETVLRKIHSADGYPGVQDSIQEHRFRLYDARADGALRGPPGTLLARSGEAICRATRDSAVWIGTLAPLDETLGTFKRPATLALGSGGLGALVDSLPEKEPSEPEIDYHECNGIGYLSFELYNGAMSSRQCRRLQAAYRRARERPTRVLVLTGGSDFWCNGMHLHCIEAADSAADASWENINAIDDLAQEILGTEDRFTMAVLRGNAAAGGVFLALAADRVLARSGVVLNPHYRNMGNLYGSEFWTYLLPRRLTGEAAGALMRSRLPLGTEEACALGLIDAHAGPEPDVLETLVLREAAALGEPATFAARLALKRERRAREETERPLQSYRESELEHMRLNFYGFDPSYHIARYRFVHRTPHAWTPLYLAAHRRTIRAEAMPTSVPGAAATAARTRALCS